MDFGENDNDGGSKWVYTVTDIQRKRDPAFAVFAYLFIELLFVAHVNQLWHVVCFIHGNQLPQHPKKYKNPKTRKQDGR